MVKGGKFVAAEVAEELPVEFEPAAIAPEIDGLPVVMKLPQIAELALSGCLKPTGRRKHRDTYS